MSKYSSWCQIHPKFIQVPGPASGCIFFWGKEAQHSWNVPSKACAITSLDADDYSPCLFSWRLISENHELYRIYYMIEAFNREKKHQG